MRPHPGVSDGTAQPPDDDTCVTAMILANRAPSIHNSQPWQWRVGSSRVHLYAQPALHLPHTDPDGRDLMVSCGATLHHCVVAFAALGWRAVVHRLPNPAEPHHLASVELYSAAPTAADIALAAAIPRRRTDRRPYGSRPVALGDIALMGARAARLGVTLRRVEPTTELRALLAEAVLAHVSDPDYLGELTTWSGRYASVAGVPARSTPRSDPTAAVPMRLFAGPELAAYPPQLADSDEGVLIALGTLADDSLARLRAGEAASAVLLTATAQGLASCPISEPLEIEGVRQGLRDLAFDDDGFPQMLVRVGWAPTGADTLPSTPRRPLADFARRLDGTPYF